MHRFVWDMRWSSSGTREELEDEGFGAPRGPKIVPGTYQVTVTVDGTVLSEPLQVQMDPRSKATLADLQQQQILGLEVFGQVKRSRQALAEMKAVTTSLDKLEEQLKDKPELQTESKKLAAAIETIQKGSKASDGIGLETASGGLQSVLRVVESGDRTTPQQAIEVYDITKKAANARIDEWKALKSGALAEFNQALEKAGLQPMKIAEIDLDAEEHVAK
jgi:hypothetical protein